MPGAIPRAPGQFLNDSPPMPPHFLLNRLSRIPARFFNSEQSGTVNNKMRG